MPPSHRSDPVNIPRHHVLDRFKRELHGRESELTGLTPASRPGVETNPGRFAICLYLNSAANEGCGMAATSSTKSGKRPHNSCMRFR